MYIVLDTALGLPALDTSSTNCVDLMMRFGPYIKHKKHQWKESMIRGLEEIEDKNPTEYWKLIKELKDRKAEKQIINPEEFEDFFKRLFAVDNTPTDI